MPDMGLQDLQGSGFRPERDISPDSVIFTAESNFSLFSSASGSVERCSFASDVPDHLSLASEVSQHLAGRGLSSGPDLDPNKPTFLHKKNVHHHIRKEKAKVHKVDSSEAETTEDENVAGDSARNSFSQALKDCQDRRLRSELLLKKAERQRPASLDLNNSVVNVTKSTSPRLEAMKKASASTTRRIGAFPSPGTPNYRHASKGWSSERIPPNAATYRRNLNNTMLPYNNSGRTLPSKWEDAERWIFSPVLGDGGSVKTSLQQQNRRPKSKSGPLGPPGIAYNQMFSPATPMFDGGNIGKVIATSPFCAGGMTADGLSMSYGGREGIRNILLSAEPCMARSVSIHGCSDQMLRQSSLNTQLDEKYEDTEVDANNVSRAVSRRDMATQMSPQSSLHSSPRKQSPFSTATVSVADSQSVNSSRPKVKDVTVDDMVSMTRWSKKNKPPGGGSRNVVDWKNKAVSIGTSSWRDVSSDATNSISKMQREEAKIIAWENLQKAKAEAAMRKLEMKLEKKRSSSMDKIMKKLRSAQKKAQHMRSSSGLASQVNHSGRSSNKSLSFRRSPQIGSLSGCFTCHAFSAS